MTFAKAIQATPVFNKKALDQHFSEQMGLDEQGLFRPLEFIAFPGTLFEVLSSFEPIAQVKVSEYSVANTYYVDCRFLQESKDGSRRIPILPSKQEILKRLADLEGRHYLWGGNWPQGIPQMERWYPKPSFLSLSKERIWSLDGVDCSGIFYYATDGWLPRNTTQLVHCGSSVPIFGKDLPQILSSLRPLDLIAWCGHVIGILNGREVIESRPQTGVTIHNLKECLSSLLQERAPVDDWDSTENLGKRFVVRRWLGNL